MEWIVDEIHKFRYTYRGIQYTEYERIIQWMIRTSEKEYNEKLSPESRNNIVKHWKIIIDVINKRQNATKTVTFRISEHDITDQQKIAEKFTELYVNIGPSLAKKSSWQAWSHYLYQEWYCEFYLLAHC